MSTKTTKAAAPATTPVPATVKKVVKPAETAAAPVAAAPAPAPAKKAAAAPKKEEVVAPAPVAAPAAPAPVEVVVEAAAPAPAAEAATPAVVEGGALGAASEEKLKTVVSRVNELLDTLKAVAAELKVLQKQVGKDFKEAAKASRSRRGKRGGGVAGAEKAKRSPSGFAKPTDLSAALCTFLGVDAGTQLARTEVTKKITEYIKTHNLQNAANKKIIIPDATLATLLNNNGEEVTYFNLQKFLKVHFTKA